MSKIGLRAIKLDKAELSREGDAIAIKGPKGNLAFVVPKGIVVTIEKKQVVVRPAQEIDLRVAKPLWGMTRATLANKIKGVESGFESKVNIVGLGFKAVLTGKNLNFSLGYSHKIDVIVPDGIAVNVSKTGQELMVSGIDKLAVGNFCAHIKSLKQVEPYKGKGIFLDGEKIYRKAGKTKKA